MADRDRSSDALTQGTWHIVRSSLPMWRNTAGAISYSPLPDGSVGDVVTSCKEGKISHIVGIDHAIEADGWQWEWRGVQPLTFFIRSRWRFIAGDADAGWAVTLFEKTMLSAAGIDIYSRTPRIAADSLTLALFEPPHWQR